MASEEQKRDAAIEQVEQNNRELVECGLVMGRALARDHAEITSDMIRRELLQRLDTMLLDAAKHNGNRWLGPVMQKLKREGVIEPTDRTVNTRTHAGVSRVWRSLIRGK